MPDQPTIDEVLAAAVALVRTRGPIAVDALMQEVEAAGRHLDRDFVIDELVDTHHVWWIADHLLFADQVLPDRTWAHRLTQAEIDGGFVAYEPDLHCLTLDEADLFATPLGELTHDAHAGRLVGPAHCLRRYAAGDVVRFGWASPGTLTISADAGGDGAREAEAIRTAFTTHSNEGAAMLLEVLVGVILADDTAFRDAPPLTELVDRAGLSVQGDQIAEADFDWEAARAAHHDRHMQNLAERHDMTRESAELLWKLTEGYYAREEVDDDIDAAACADALRDPDATFAFLEDKIGRDAKTLERLDALRSRVEHQFPDCAGLALLGARCAEIRGDALAHANELNRAIRSDPDFWPAHAERAWVRSDSGDARGAVTDMEYTGEYPHLATAVARFADPGPTKAGRNDACPCGSELKHKVCCGPTNGYPLHVRAIWLFAKALWFATRPPQQPDIDELLEEAIAAVDVADSLPLTDDELVDAFAEDAVVLEAALFTSGLLRRFHEQRRLLLPADEAALLESWLDATTSVYRVEGFVDGHVELVDLGNDARATVFTTEAGLAAGDLIGATVLSDGREPCVLFHTPIDPSLLDGVRANLTNFEPLTAVIAHVQTRLLAMATQMANVDPALHDIAAWRFPWATEEQRAEVAPDELVRLEYPDVAAAAARGDDQVDLDGTTVHPRVFLMLHTIVAQQLITDDPPEVFETVIRLSAEGYDREAILAMLAFTVIGPGHALSRGATSWNTDAQIAALDGLPGSFFKAHAAD